MESERYVAQERGFVRLTGNGDIILRTDGRRSQSGLLYQAEHKSPGRLAEDLDAEVRLLEYAFCALA